MLSAVLFAAAANMIKPPTPIDPVNWIGASDYPADLELKDVVYTRFQLIVAADGSVQRCDITQPSGSQRLDQLVCAKMTERGHFAPATDQNGRPIASVFKRFVLWQRGSGTPLPREQTDFRLEVPHVPQGLPSPAIIALNVIISARGAIEACDGGSKPDEKPLAKIGCEHLAQRWHPVTVTDAEGAPLRVLHPVLVGFIEQEIRTDAPAKK
ncbi:energy transducer TonB [Sphingomonas sanxanigenens]|uniref:TonB C-terminal domain-containing protein n=1 Tax=Sphingomonas sanxanigenens DSM 19645 = NX02 TaxID=1123269 RepID=W0A8D0_9SPHN|nr:hypothetical protein [Sphingomonas sanxanigenens]AHE52563.1 hypothetical protein NX02_04050 [Sphingomonas sanxanigenens DSM 19645 = NX02]